ncbi:MAG: DUF3147 family protein [Sphingomicrobium sp.]
MIYFLFKAAFTGVLAAAISEIARRHPGWGGLLASLPLTSLMAIVWLYRDTGDVERVSQLSWGVSFFILPSLPMFVALPLLLKSGWGFWPALGLLIVATLGLYALTFWAAPRFGVRL